MTRYLACGLLVGVMSTTAAAQTPRPQGDESRAAAEVRTEWDRIREDCGKGIKGAPGCLITFVTDHPLHLALGSIAPQNGFGVGGAASWVWNTADLPSNISADAVRSASGAWRAGVYFKVTQADRGLVQVVGPGEGSDAGEFIRTRPIYEMYAQSVSLPVLSYYGLGNDSRRSDRSIFSMDQTMAGGSAIVPIALGASRVRIALLGEMAGRRVRTSSGPTKEGPGVAETDLAAGAAGFGATNGFVELGGGLRARMALGRRSYFAYEARYQQFFASDGAPLDFTRMSVDLDHQFSIYRRFRTAAPSEQSTPNGCSTDTQGRCEPAVEPLRRPDRSWNRSGVFGVRMLYEQSKASGDNRVPFYFLPTLGGANIDGQRLLGSYDDYRFRGPRLFLVQESFEHSIAGPIGAFVEMTHGRVGMDGDALTSRLRSSLAVGATIRAGAAPMVTLSYATGGSEGRHFIALMSTRLLGGGGRPAWR